MECPRCKQSQPAGRVECSACGVIFAKWEAQQQRLTELQPTTKPASDPVMPLATDEVLKECDSWIRNAGRWASVLLLLGFVWPLYKASLLAADSLMIWPWSLIAPPDRPILATAMAFDDDEAQAMRSTGTPVMPKDVAIVPLQPNLEEKRKRQLVVRYNDSRGVIIVDGYTDPTQKPVFTREWTLPTVAPGPGVRELFESQVETGIAYQTF